jgi:uncharacterized protein YjiS (DUF1127 family)
MEIIMTTPANPAYSSDDTQNLDVPRSRSNRLLTVIRRALARRRQRQALTELDARLLKDVGISRAQVAAECSKPLWK